MLPSSFRPGLFLVEFSKAAGILVLAEAVGSVPPAHRRSNATNFVRLPAEQRHVAVRIGELTLHLSNRSIPDAAAAVARTQPVRENQLPAAPTSAHGCSWGRKRASDKIRLGRAPNHHQVQLSSGFAFGGGV